jgi:hypothetical protein
VSVQNNVSINNGPTNFGCDPSLTNQVDIGVYDGAVGKTIVDYNSIQQTMIKPPYAWSTPMSLAAFRAASGQAAHDTYESIPDDSANSAAPGYQSTDFYGHPREDNPDVTDTGAGPITYADRGCTEHIQEPTARLVIRADQSAVSITADASGTTGWVPVVSYANDRYVSADVTGDRALIANRAAIGSGELFDLVEPGNGQVALRSHVSGLYVTVEATNGSWLIANSTTTGNTALFQLTTNTDGTISLKSAATGNYVSSSNGGGGLTADRSAIGDWERFTPVDVANASISLHAHANGRYVTAEAGGGQPLIASRSTVGAWEEFDGPTG